MGLACLPTRGIKESYLRGTEESLTPHEETMRDNIGVGLACLPTRGIKESYLRGTEESVTPYEKTIMCGCCMLTHKGD